MLARFSVWVLAAALGQPAAEPAWLKAVPADVDVAVRTRGLDATRQDLDALLKAASPALAAQAEPQLTNLINQLQAMHGDPATKTPWVGLIRVTGRGAPAGLPFAVMVLDGDYQGVLKGFSGGRAPANLKPAGGGLDSFDSPMGDGTWYAVKGTGFVAIGPDRGLVAAVAKPEGKTLDQVLSPDLAKSFLAGDLGAYVNVQTLATQYADQIEQGRQGLMAAMDQAAQQQGNAASIAAAKKMYDKLFASIKDASHLSLSFDLSGEGLHLASVLDLKPGTAAAKAVDVSRAGSAAELGRFPADATGYAYFNMDAKDFQQYQGMSMRMMNPDGKPSPALERAMAGFSELGRITACTVMSFEGGIRGVHVVEVADPARYLAASRAMSLALKGSGAAGSYFKDVQVTEGVNTARGFRFDRIVLKLDLNKMAQAGGPQQANLDAIKALMGGDVQTNWIGTDGKRVIQITAPTWDDARGRLESYLDGKDGVGSTAGFKAVRASLPGEVSLLMMMSSQGILRLVLTMQSNAAAKLPGDLPREPALIGVSLTPRAPAAYEFHLVLPSTVGPVFEKGIPPIVQGLPVKP